MKRPRNEIDSLTEQVFYWNINRSKRVRIKKPIKVNKDIFNIGKLNLGKENYIFDEVVNLIDEREELLKMKFLEFLNGMASDNITKTDIPTWIM